LGSIGVNVAGGAAAELPDENAARESSRGPTKFLTKRKSSKGNAIPAAMTKLNVSSDGKTEEGQLAKPVPATEPTAPEPPQTVEPPLPPDPPRKQTNEQASTFGWRGWWSRPDPPSDTAKSAEEAQRTPLPGATPSEEADAKSKELGNIQEPQKQSSDQDAVMKDATELAVGQDKDVEMKDAPATTTLDAGAKNVSNTSWFWLWSSAQNAQNSQTNPPPTVVPATETETETETETAKSDATNDKPIDSETAAPSAPIEVPPPDNTTQHNPKEPPKPSGWAFWFRDKPKTEGKADEESSQKHVGEVAVFDTPSQSHPEAAQFNEEQQPNDDPKQEPPKPAVEVTKESIAKRSFRSLRGRPKVKDTPKDTPADTPSTSKVATPTKASPNQSPTRPETAPAAQPAPKQQGKLQQEPPNLILPDFKNTYRLVQKPTYWQQIRQFFLGGEPAMPHLHIHPAPPRIKKAVAIGVHGFFPAPVFQRILGQPTGTSIRFATAARKAIEEWTQSQGYTPDIEHIALEGEGFISERVNTLWKLLLNWIEAIKQADFILVACHSQGVPVATMLVAKLIQFGCVNNARIGICAMAGINLGPFIEYKTRYFGPTALELFEFANPKSLVSQMYLAALDEVLRYGARITYVGSIDDQLVSLEVRLSHKPVRSVICLTNIQSSTFSNLSHPYIYRAVFVDGRIHAPDFLTHLVGFALKLRNLGLPDHGLIRELSPALAGSLYGGEGHSRIYDEPYVYALSVQHAMETTSLPISPAQQRPSTSASLQTALNIPVPGAKIDEKNPYALRVKDYESVGSGNQNPYYLPWAARGLLEEEFVKKELGQEVEELLEMFEEWKPTKKELKDVKFRLEGVRSKL
jgi:hypothetical protein